MKKITCVIVDDEPYARNLIRDYIQKVSELELLDKFSHPVEALDFLKKNKADILFLDIEMPDIDGMGLVDLLDDPPSIIFTTAYSEYAVESYEKNALDYLLKPITFDRFLQSVWKYKEIQKHTASRIDKTQSDKIFLKSDSTYVAMKYKDIFYIEGLGDYVTFYTRSEKIIVYHTIKKLVDLLPKQFVRSHYSYIVNFDHVKKAEKNGLLIADKRIPVSRTYRAQVMKKIENSLL